MSQRWCLGEIVIERHCSYLRTTPNATENVDIQCDRYEHEDEEPHWNRDLDITWFEGEHLGARR